MFFRLNAFAFLVAGEKDYSIYDMKNNFIYMLNREAGMLIKRLENNVDLDTLKEYEKHKNVCMDFLGMLAQKGLGDFFENEVHIEKFRFNAPIQKKGMLEPVPQYVKCYLEISNECNLKCSFCGKSKYINWLGCQSCFRNQNHQEASIKYDKLVSELEEIGVKELILGGREPFCKSEVIYKLIEQCKKNSRINLIITTPGSVEANEILKVSSLYEKIKLNIVVFATRRFSEFLSEEMQEFIRKQEKLFSVLHKNSDKIVCAIIWNKMQICEQRRIEFEVNMQDITFDFMDKTDITALFANLLDNAVEACEESSIQCKKIILRIHRFKEYIVIKVCNTIGTKPKIKEGKLVSTKNGHLGMGMMILENLANKYCGNMDYEYSDTYFETNLILSVYNGMCER